MSTEPGLDFQFYYRVDPEHLDVQPEAKSATQNKRAATTLNLLKECVEKIQTPHTPVSLESVKKLKELSHDLEAHLETKIKQRHPILGKIILFFQRRFGLLSRLGKCENEFAKFFNSAEEQQSATIDTSATSSDLSKALKKVDPALHKTPWFQNAAQTLLNRLPLDTLPPNELPGALLRLYTYLPEEDKNKVVDAAWKVAPEFSGSREFRALFAKFLPNQPTWKIEEFLQRHPEEKNVALIEQALPKGHALLTTIALERQKEEVNKFINLLSTGNAPPKDFTFESPQLAQIVQIEVINDPAWLRRFIATKPHDETVDKVVNVLKQPTIILRYKQLSQIKDQAEMQARKVLAVALDIEDELSKIKTASSHYFKGTTRSLVFDKEAEEFYVLLKHKFSPGNIMLDASGTYRKVTAAVRLPLDARAKSADLEIVAQSVTKDDLTEAELKSIRREEGFFRELGGSAGIWKQLFCFIYTKSKTYASKRCAFLVRADCDLKGLPALSLADQIRVTKSLIQGLATMHEKGLVHADIKPENALFKRLADGSIVAGWIDFGFMFRVDTDKPSFVYAEGSYGTTKYSAPELIGKKDFRDDFYKTDLWALGCTLYEMHFKKEASWYESIKDYDAVTSKVARDIEAPMNALLKKQKKMALGKDEQFELLIYKMLQTDPQKRIDMSQALEEIGKLTK